MMQVLNLMNVNIEDLGPAEQEMFKDKLGLALEEAEYPLENYLPD